MERRFPGRREQMMAEAELLPEQWRELLQELAEFVQPLGRQVGPALPSRSISGSRTAG